MENETELKKCPFCGCPINFDKNNGIYGWHKDDCFFQFLKKGEVDMSEE